MDEQLFKILKKVYNKKRYIKDEQGYQIAIETGDVYDCKTGTKKYAMDTLSAKEKQYLTESKYPVNEIVYDLHDENIRKLKEILHHPNLTWNNLIYAYIAGFESFPRGRQPILSYLFAKSVPIHSFCNAHGGEYCEICGMQKEFYLEKGNEIFLNYWGYSWNEVVSTFYLDLAEFSKLEPVTPTENDWNIFYSVIELIRNAPKEETVGKLEQRIKNAKLIPNCEKYRLRGQLITLAELGVMPNSYIPPLFDKFTDASTLQKIDGKIPGSPRSDVPLPLSGWHGKNGICNKRLSELFEVYY